MLTSWPMWRKTTVPTGMTKDVFIELKLHQALIETRGLRSAGNGRTSRVRLLLLPERDPEAPPGVPRARTTTIWSLTTRRAWSASAGEIIENVDILLVISDATAKGVRTAGRIYELARQLQIGIGTTPTLIVTRIADLEPLKGDIEATGLELLGAIPDDPLVTEYDLQGKPLMGLPADSPAVSASMKLFDKLRF